MTLSDWATKHPTARTTCRSPRRAITDVGQERFPLFDDIRGQLRSFPAADVPRRVDLSGRDEEDIARLERHRRLSLDLVLQRRPFENIDDLFTGMRVPGGRHPRVEFDDRLNDLASGDAEIVPLEIDASDSCLLRPRHVQNQTARDDDRRHYHHSRRSHVNLFPVAHIRDEAVRERERLNAGIEALDLQCAIDDRFRLPDSLIQPLFDHSAAAVVSTRRWYWSALTGSNTIVQ